MGRGLHRHPPLRARRSARRTRIILACVEPPDGGPAIALFSETCEARATLATNPEGPVLSFSTDGNIVAEIGVAVIDPATPKSGPYIMLARANGDPLLHLRVDSEPVVRQPRRGSGNRSGHSICYRYSDRSNFREPLD